MLRTIEFAILAALGLIFIGFIAPQQLPVALYKGTLVLIGGYLGYWADRWLFPYARPDSFQLVEVNRSSFNLSMIRRAIIVAACILGLTLGL